MIFYFSGTGNTFHTASLVAEATNDRMISIADALTSQTFDYALEDNERIGFFFPVHGWRPPFIVRKFIQSLHIENTSTHYVYAFATCGDDVGMTFGYLRDDLKTVDIHLDSIFSVIMPESHLFPLVDLIDTPEKAKDKWLKGEEKTKEYIPHIEKRERGLSLINTSRWPRTNSVLLGSFFLRYWIDDKKFTVDKDACIGCGKCANVCPVHNIVLNTDKNPEWQHNGLCTACFACYHHCPKHAIDYAKRGKGKRQMTFFSD